MAGSTELKADKRSMTGKQIAKRLRLSGSLPAVVYSQEQAVACSVDRKSFEDLLHEQGRNAIVALKVDGDSERTTIIKELQHHPLRGDILHIDFHEISLTEKVVVEVSVEAVGTPVGVRSEGGILEHRLHLVEVECLPMEIPEKIEVDVSAMAIGDNIHVSDLSVGPNVEIVSDPERSVFVVVPPTVLKSAAEEGEEEEGEIAEEGEEPTEPELVDERGKKDDDEDGEDS